VPFVISIRSVHLSPPLVVAGAPSGSGPAAAVSTPRAWLVMTW
jgi:hypothetical protein